MSQEIRIPDIGDAEDVEVVEVLVSAGDLVGEDDPVIVIESDKASMEVPAGVSGTIDALTVSVGDKVSQGQVIAKLKAGAEGANEGADERADERADEPDTEKSVDERAAPDDAPAPQEPPKQAADAEAPDRPSQDGEPARNREPEAGQHEVDVVVPDIGEAENVEVIEVAVKPGDHVDEDGLLVVVESDKASMEIPSTHAGTVKEVHVSVGTQVEQGTKLVTLLRERSPDREPPRDRADQAGSGESNRPERAPAPAKDARPAPSPAPAAPSLEPAAPSPEPAAPVRGRETAPTEEETAPRAGAEVYAGPAVRRLARELGIDLAKVDGSGNRGRIVKDDVKDFVKERLSGGAAPAGGGLPAVPVVDFSRFGEIEEQALSRTRASGAQNLHRAWLNIPHVTQHDEVDVTDLEDFRASLKAEAEKRGVKLTPLAFIIKACCHVLKEFPTFNASLDPAAKTFILKRYYHIGMAVDTPEGLVVPVIRDADQKGVWELSAEVVELAEKARDRKLGMNDMQGGSFSVSSLGAIGGTGFTPIINAPEVAILGVSRVAMRPVWRGEAFVPRKMMPLSLSYDHRAVNGAEAGRFVTRLGEILSDIRRLAL